MNKLAALLVVIVGAGIIFYFILRDKPSTPSLNSSSINSGASNSSATAQSGAPTFNGANQGDNADFEDLNLGDVQSEEPVRIASQAYKNADEAIAAVKNGASDYSDVVLEQFTQPTEDCSWCPQFYDQLRSLLVLPDTTLEQRAYYSELLAISGKPENIQYLVDLIKNAPTPEAADEYSKALELTLGNEDVTKLLAEQIASPNELLAESSLAAITNQGSLMAAELLYKAAVDKSDADGFYSKGIGLGELVPEKESLPYIQELALKRDQYSHLAIKALLNEGPTGTRMAFDILRGSKNQQRDRELLLKDASNHVTFDEDTENFLKAEASSNTPFTSDVAREMLAAFEVPAEDDALEEEENDADAMMSIPPSGK